MSNAALGGHNRSVCPFCGSAVAEELTKFGGPCPHCFAEIPGEEAATDPGDEERERQERSDSRRRVYRAVVPIFLALPVVAIAVIFALYVLFKPEPEVQTLNLDNAEYWQADLEDLMVITASETEGEEAETVAVAKTGGGSNSTAPGDPSGDPLASVVAPRVGEAGPGGPRKVGTQGADGPDVDVALKSAGGASDNPFAEIGVSVKHKRESGVTLTNDNDIIEMIKSVLGAETPRLQSCYDRRLKVVEGLRGAWVLNFTVTKGGKVVKARATGKQQSDADLESCIAGKVAHWRFQPIKADMPVQKTVHFRPS